jgi:L-idonate 5-dehydrogenase
MRFPHVQGGFRESLVCSETQAVPVPDQMTLSEAAFAEPLAVCIHAVKRAGSLLGKAVLVTGSGPIGVLITAVARRAGAKRIAVCDILSEPLRYARQMGADATIDIANDPAGLDQFERDKGSFDVVFEASGSAAGLLSGLRCVRPRGVVVCVGQGAEAVLPVSNVVTKEAELRGAFRFHEEFETAVSFIAQRLVTVSDLLTSVVPASEPRTGFELAADKRKSMKVQLQF